MIGILIKNNEKTLFTGLPKETEKLEKQLAGIGLNVPLQEVNLSNHNDIGYELEIYAQSQIDMEVASRIILHDNIGQLNDLMLYISQGDSDKMYDRICESHAETISDLYSELTTPPEIETTDKLVIRTTMNYKANFYEPADCIVEKAIAIPHEEYSALINITDNCYDFIADNQECMYYDKDNNSHCLLIYDEESGDGILINADGCNFPKYSAFIPHAKEIIEQHDLELSGLKTVKAPITESEKRLIDIISSAADRIATFAHLGHKDFTIEDTLKELDCDTDDFKALIRNAVAEKLNAKVGISLVEVSDLDIPFQPDISVTIEENHEIAAEKEELGGIFFRRSIMKFIKLKLFSPIMVKGEAPYENPWDGGDDYRILIEREKKKCRNEIYVNSCNALTPVSLPQCFERRIYSAVPAVEEKNGRLMLCLNCECYRTLSESELDELCGWWENKVVEANERLSKIRIKTKKLGRIIIYLWFMNGWSVEPIFPARQGGE